MVVTLAWTIQQAIRVVEDGSDIGLDQRAFGIIFLYRDNLTMGILAHLSQLTLKIECTVDGDAEVLGCLLTVIELSPTGTVY